MLLQNRQQIAHPNILQHLYSERACFRDGFSPSAGETNMQILSCILVYVAEPQFPDQKIPDELVNVEYSVIIRIRCQYRWTNENVNVIPWKPFGSSRYGRKQF